jgi:hypothetical protein
MATFNEIEAPCSKLQGIFPVRKISNFISLAGWFKQNTDCACLAVTDYPDLLKPQKKEDNSLTILAIFG